jgi:hypothetical protein
LVEFSTARGAAIRCTTTARTTVRSAAARRTSARRTSLRGTAPKRGGDTEPAEPGHATLAVFSALGRLSSCRIPSRARTCGTPMLFSGVVLAAAAGSHSGHDAARYRRKQDHLRDDTSSLFLHHAAFDQCR